jgi:hypothetical protein
VNFPFPAYATRQIEMQRHQADIAKMEEDLDRF